MSHDDRIVGWNGLGVAREHTTMEELGDRWAMRDRKIQNETRGHRVTTRSNGGGGCIQGTAEQGRELKRGRYRRQSTGDNGARRVSREESFYEAM